MSNVWAHNAAQNLLPLSKEQFSLAAALTEWLYTGNMYDLEAPVENCELCEHPDIRFQFEIRNRFTGHILLVGSECIRKFQIVALDDEGQVLDVGESYRKVIRDRGKLISEAKKKRAINTLVDLSFRDTEFNIDSFINYFQTRGAFTPNQLATLFWRFEKYHVQYTATDFKMTIKRNREKDQLIEMPEWRRRPLLPCLTSSQRAFLERELNSESP